MEIRLQKSHSVEENTQQSTTWFSVWADRQPKIYTQDEEKAKRFYHSLVEFYKEHGTVDPEPEILAKETFPDKP